MWLYKVQFSENAENSATKGESIEWQTPTITGRIMGVRNDATLLANYRRIATFDTLAAAVTWLDTKAGI